MDIFTHFSLGIFLGLESLGLRVEACLFLENTTKQFSKAELSSVIAVGCRLSLWLFKFNFKQNFKLSPTVTPAQFKCSVAPGGSWSLFGQCRQSPFPCSENFLWCSKLTSSISQNTKSGRTHESAFYQVRVTIVSWVFCFSNIFVDVCTRLWCEVYFSPWVIVKALSRGRFLWPLARNAEGRWRGKERLWGRGIHKDFCGPSGIFVSLMLLGYVVQDCIGYGLISGSICTSCKFILPNE